MELCLRIFLFFPDEEATTSTTRRRISLRFYYKQTVEDSKEGIKEHSSDSVQLLLSSHALKVKEVENYANLLGRIRRGFPRASFSGFIKLR